MKTPLYALGLAVVCSVSSLQAQCSFTPTIAPTTMILCPNESDTLYTQVYDAYQWYRNGVAIPGATQQFLVVDEFTYSGTMVSVDATLSGCTERSDSVLVDSWAFPFPYVIHHGTPADVGDNGESYFCHGDTAWLELGLPYTESIQWTRGGVPIPGANNTILEITQNGGYSVSAAPMVCPNYVLNLGVTVYMYFLPPFTPTIQYAAPNLYTTDGVSWQWYLNGNAIPGATDSILANPVPGTYTVYAADTLGCEGQSTPFELETNSVNNPEDMVLHIYPNPTAELLYIQGASTIREITFTDLAGRTMLSLSNTTVADVRSLAGGIYLVTVQLPDRTITQRIVVQR